MRWGAGTVPGDQVGRMRVLRDSSRSEMISRVKDGKINSGPPWKRKVCLVCRAVLDLAPVSVRSWIFLQQPTHPRPHLKITAHRSSTYLDQRAMTVEPEAPSTTDAIDSRRWRNMPGSYPSPTQSRPDSPMPTSNTPASDSP